MGGNDKDENRPKQYAKMEAYCKMDQKKTWEQTLINGKVIINIVHTAA